MAVHATQPALNLTIRPRPGYDVISRSSLAEINVQRILSLDRPSFYVITLVINVTTVHLSMLTSTDMNINILYS